MEKDKPAQRTPRAKKTVPQYEPKIIELPNVGKPENTVTIGGTLVEIKPTLMRYVIDGTANFYKALDLYSVIEIGVWEETDTQDGRDGVKCIMDWLIAATDSADKPDFIVSNYEAMGIDTIEKILSIFKRVNKIDEREEKRKNLEREKETKV